MVSGLVPNRRSHPLGYEWTGVTFRGGEFDSLATFDDYWNWIEGTMTTEETPWLKIIRVMVGNATAAVTNSAAGELRNIPLLLKDPEPFV